MNKNHIFFCVDKSTIFLRQCQDRKRLRGSNQHKELWSTVKNFTQEGRGDCSSYMDSLWAQSAYLAVSILQKTIASFPICCNNQAQFLYPMSEVLTQYAAAC